MMDEPIAIIGLNARLPGDGDTAERFYEFLLAGRSARTEVPPERYNSDAFWHPDATRSGTTRARFGHFLKGSIAAFDAPFFSITPTEASSMDPQQRGMLESVYKALENAGIPLPVAAGSQTGVYVGCFSSDYHDITAKDLDIPSKYAATGNVASMLSNRVSWFFDFRGPSVTIDTACSSSLVAAHEACMSLKLREISMAVVGGCNLILSPEMTLNLDAAGVLGPDGKSYSFDHRGNGYARGEGFGTVVLKRVSDAIRDGDVIRAVIRNSSSNQDGRSPGITQPTKEAQAKLIGHVYSRAGLDPSVTRFFEAHGTGTAVGDPIEASAISEIFTRHRSPDEPLYVGALKSNVGHLEGAAGVASIIKGVLTLERGIIPANTWFEKANPKIQESWHLKFPTEATQWPQSGLRRMSINSFGVGGSNAHLVMDDALHFLQKYRLVGNHRTDASPRSLKLAMVNGNGLTNGHTNGHTNGLTNGLTNGFHHTNGDTQQSEGTVQVLVASSYDQEGVPRMQDAYTEYLTSRSADPLVKPERFLRDLAHTLTSKRTHHAWRSFSIAQSNNTWNNAFEAMTKPLRAKSEPRLAFVFTGQGAQWPAMGIELMRYPTFQQSLFAADKYLNELGCPWSLTYELSKGKGASRIDDADFSQPLCTALQVALVDLLSSWNIYPDAITGHSSGEVAAAYAAGAISREAAWKVSYYRGKLSAELLRAEAGPKTGMAAVGLDKEATQAIIENINRSGGSGSLEIACMNSAQSQTVSGEASKIDALVEQLTEEKKFARKLNVKLAYHSQYMKAMAAEYLDVMGVLEPGSGKTPRNAQFFSSTVGTIVSHTKLQDPAYWVDNLVSPVRFYESVTAMLSGSRPKINGFKEGSPPARVTDILEIGPHGALKGPLSAITKQVQGGDAAQYHTLLVRKRSAVDSALEMVGSLFCHGYDVDLPAVNQASGHKPLLLTDLPSYPFNHSKEYWLESKQSRDFRFRSAPRHELLGAPVNSWNKDEAIWRNYIRLSENPWIEDHKVSGDLLYPAAGMLVMAIEASRQIADTSQLLKGFRFRDVSFHMALRVPDDALGVESHFYLRPYRETTLPVASSWNEFQLSTFQDGSWREHCRGQVQTEYEFEHDPPEGSWADRTVQSSCDQEIKDAQGGCTAKISAEKVYRGFRESGLDFGPTFRTLSELSLGPAGAMFGRVDSSVDKLRKLMPHNYLQPFLVHPATLDGIIQANLAPLVLSAKSPQQATVPVYANDLWISAGHHESYFVAAQAKPRGRQESESSVTAVQVKTGRPMVYASGLVFMTIPGNASHEQSNSKHGAFNIDWKPDPTLLRKDQYTSLFGLPMAAEDNPSEWMEDCEALCLAYIRQFLSSKGDVDKMGWHHQRYVAWMEHIVEGTGELPDQEVEALETRVKARGTPEGALIIAVGRALQEMLGGSLDPLNVIFGDKIAENVYRHGLGSKRCYVQLCNYIDALAHKNPNLRILEIGAGTGGATVPVVETLTAQGRRYQRYDFTDISPSFFEQAKVKFEGELGHMEFRVLNVEKDPLDQGFEAGQYDVVLAANVLHATKSIDVSLSHAKSLLKPGGKLLLFEITNTTILLGTFCFGVLPGWWLSEDTDRNWGPLMSADSWKEHLVASGFNGLDAVFHDFPDTAHQTSSILVSTVPATNPPIQSQDRTYILLDNTSSLQRDISAGITNVIVQQAPCEAISLTELHGVNLTGATCIVLAELEAAILENMTQQTFDSVKSMVTQCKTLIWCTRDGTAAPEAELVTGLARAARLERPGFRFSNVAFEEDVDVDVIVEKCIQALGVTLNSTENWFRVAGGLTHIPRLVDAGYLTDHVRAQTSTLPVVEKPLGEISSRHLALQIGALGQLDSLAFADDPLADTPLGDHEVEFKTMACDIDVHDLASALGKIDESALGSAAAGVVTKVGSASAFQVGDRVFGLSFSGTIKTHVRSTEGFLAKVPSTMSWEEAASIPVPYTTVYAVLHETGSLTREDTILVHPAGGKLGQAALQLAQLQGAEMFATASSEEERDFLEKTYSISQDHVFSEQDPSFTKSIRRMTGGRGVDIVIHSRAGEGLGDAWDCVAPFGRLVELGVGDAHADVRLSRGQHRNSRFESFDLYNRGLHDSVRTQGSFQRAVKLVLDGLETSPRAPLTVYPFSQVQDAFRELASRDCSMVLTASDEDVVSVVPSQEILCQFDPKASYVISGGLGGLGRSVARWMASRGAKNLILLSRRGPVDDSAKQLIAELESVCDRVSAPACDATDAESLKGVIAKCLTYMPPIKGCIQGAMVLKDNRLEDMSVGEWNDAVRSKVDTSWNLHHVLGQDLDFFVLLSSAVGVTGNPEQANYAAGSTFQDAFARHLASKGLHAVSLDLPVILGVGFVAEKPELLDYMRSTGWTFIREDEFHAVLDYHCRPETVPVVRSQVVPRLWLPQETAAEGYSLPAWRNDALFSHLKETEIIITGKTATEKDVNHAALLSSATTVEAAEKIVLDALLLKISRVLSVELSNLDPTKPLHAYGVDSLVAVELRSWISKELSAEVSVFDITSKSSIYQLAGTATVKSKLVPQFKST